MIKETDVHNHVVVVEGFFGCMRLSEAGFPCVALMGSSLSDAQEDMIAGNFKSMTLLFDDDEAGEKGRGDALLRLSLTDIRVRSDSAQWEAAGHAERGRDPGVTQEVRNDSAAGSGQPFFIAAVTHHSH